MSSGKNVSFFSFFVCALYRLYSESCIVYTAKKTYSSPARYIFSVTNYFGVS